MTTALDGLSVLDVSGTISTAFCAKQLADYGAEVVNLEPAGGFPTRYEAPFLPGREPPENSGSESCTPKFQSVSFAGSTPGAGAPLYT